MNGVTRGTLLLALALSSLVACSSLAPPKQWYKPGINYTVAEFQRDRTACTKDRVVDEDCLRQHGWVSLSGDEKKYVPPTPAPGTRGTRTTPY